jgi:hypothetical protein
MELQAYNIAAVALFIFHNKNYSVAPTCSITQDSATLVLVNLKMQTRETIYKKLFYSIICQRSQEHGYTLIVSWLGFCLW